MNRRELIDLCLTYPDAYEDYPFDLLPDENATAVIRHKKNRRSFALILRQSCVNRRVVEPDQQNRLGSVEHDCALCFRLALNAGDFHGWRGSVVLWRCEHFLSLPMDDISISY